MQRTLTSGFQRTQSWGTSTSFRKSLVPLTSLLKCGMVSRWLIALVFSLKLFCLPIKKKKKKSQTKTILNIRNDRDNVTKDYIDIIMNNLLVLNYSLCIHKSNYFLIQQNILAKLHFFP